MNNVIDPVRVQASVLKFYKGIEARRTAPLKARTNLIPNDDLIIKGNEVRRGFLGMLLGAYSQSPYGLFAGLAAYALAPQYVEENPEIISYFGDKKNRSRIAKNMAGFIGSGLLSKVKRDDQGFIATVYVIMAEANDYRTALAAPSPMIGIDDGVHVGEVDYRKMVNVATRDSRAQALLTSCLVGAAVEAADNKYYVSLRFRITKAEAQHMTNKSWATIRDIDIYPIIQLWGHNALGMTGRTPIQSYSLAAIARTLPKDPAVMNIKVNNKQLTCSREGQPLFILRECDNTAIYEDRLAQAGRASDGFALAEVGDTDNARQLPADMPVLTDWLNSKFAYTNSYGQMMVRNLANCRAANVSHIATWMKKVISDKDFKQVVNVAKSGVDGGFTVRPSDFDDNEVPAVFRDLDIIEYAGAASARMQALEERKLQWGDLAYNSHYDFLRPLGRYFRTAYQQIIANIDPVFTRYSVDHVVRVLPWIIICSEYAPSRAQVEAESAAINSAALNQKGDPSYVPDEAPALWNGDCGLQPHQARIADLLKDSPQFAILAVPAGGGKTPSITFDVLTQHQKGIGSPYLIMCPSHLVAQYVKEINFFTKGRLNVIPIVTRVYNVNGPERLTDILANAPRNTVVVCDYDALVLKSVSLCYGTTNVNIFPIADLLRQFSFGYVALDESHYVKNPTSARTQACMSLIADIPMKRLASGTLAHDSPTDLVGQIAMLDPTIFGTVDEFNEKYGLEVKGNRVIQWKPGYERAITADLKARVVECRAHRKEWAALLPPSDEAIIPVALTESQRVVYQSILQESLEAIRNDPKLSKAMNEQKGSLDEEDEEDLDLAGMLQPYIARLEQFINAPDKDPLGNELLRGADRVSPKIAVINDLLAQHIDGGVPGKVLIFTNYTATAEHIFENIEPRFRQMAIPYKASNKVEDGAEFEKNDKKKILIGVEVSLNTGLNLQHASMLIRLETVWTPGALEQGNSRINRPSLKVEDNRDAVYYRWIVCDRSIDVTKMSRLTAKIVAVAKFENADNPAYAELPDLEIIPLTMETIATENTWSGTLMAYGQGYRDYRQLVNAEYAEYKEKYIAKYGKNFMRFFGDGGTAEDSALADGIPWVPGLEVAAEQELNLIRVDQYLRMEAEGDSDDETETTAEEEDAWRKEMAAKLKGQKVFCEYGEGVITGVGIGLKILLVRVGNKQYKGIRFAAAFVQGKPLSKPIRYNQSKFTNMPVQKVTEIDPATRMTVVRKTAKELKEEKIQIKKKAREVKVKKVVDLTATINMVSTNGFIGLRLVKDQHSPDVQDILQAQGFRPDLATRRARMKTAKMLNDQMLLWLDKGFSISQEMEDEGTLEAFGSMYELLKSRQIQQDKMVYKMVTKQNLRNFYRVEMRPTKERKTLKIYPVIEDGYAYIYMGVKGQAGNRTAIRYKAPGVIWEEAPETLSWYCTRPAQVKAMLKNLVSLGIKLTNVKQLEKQYSSLRKAKSRKDASGQDVDQ